MFEFSKALINKERDLIRRLSVNSKFAERVKKTREQYKIPKEGFGHVKEGYFHFKKLENSDKQDANFESDIRNLMADSYLSWVWYRGLRAYILTDNIELLVPTIRGPRVKLRENKNDKHEGIDIEIDHNTTPDEVAEIMAFVQDMLQHCGPGFKFNKMQPYHNFNRDKLAYDLKVNMGLKNKEIAQELTKRGYDVEPKYVYTLIKRFEKEVHRNLLN